PVVATLHIVLTRPDQFDGSTAQALGDYGCFTLDVRIRRRSPPESSSGQFGVKRYLLRFQAQHFGDCHAVYSLKLRAGPYLGAIAIKSYGGIQWLHGGVRKIREFVFGHHAIA